MSTKMKVEVWSDIMCPFCYIGKKYFEKGLSQFADAKNIDLVWKSYQLDPGISNDLTDRLDTYEYMSQRKGISKDRMLQIHDQVTQMAVDAGLEFHLDKTVMVNSFRAHRFLQLAKERGRGDEAGEALFYANFTEGKDFSDKAVLVAIAQKIGLTEDDVTESLTNEKYTTQVNEDINEAKRIGITGVPFFLFNGKFALSGAQPSESFTAALEQSYAEWKTTNPETALKVSEGPSCSAQGNCK